MDILQVKKIYVKDETGQVYEFSSGDTTGGTAGDTSGGATGDTSGGATGDTSGVATKLNASLTGNVTLTNTKVYPFNDSEVSVVLSFNASSTDYHVLTEVLSGNNVGTVKITDKQVNGFKLAYTGSCEEASIKYTVLNAY